MNYENEANNVTLVLLWEVFKKRVLFVIVAFVLAASAAMVYQAVTYTPIYSSTVSIYVHNEATLPSEDAGDNAADRFNNLKLSEAMMDDCITMIKSAGVLENASAELGYPVTSNMLTVTRATENDYSHIIYITARSTDPVRAKEIADTVYGFGSGLIKSTTLTDALNVFDEARVAEAPSNSRFGYGSLLAGIVGAALVYLVFLVVYLYQERITDGDDVESKLGIVFLGNIPNRDEVEKHSRYYRNRYRSYYAYGQNKK